jgi:hypothetical protein
MLSGRNSETYQNRVGKDRKYQDVTWTKSGKTIPGSNLSGGQKTSHG